MAKPKPKRVPSDDCAVKFDEEIYYPHEGEWVELLPGVSVGETHAYRLLADNGAVLAAAQGDPNEQEVAMRVTDDVFEAMLGHLCRRVIRWNWTDLLGEPLPQPVIGDKEPLRRLDASELLWLANVVTGRTPSEEGKGSKPSPTTSSDSEPAPNLNGSSSDLSLARA